MKTRYGWVMGLVMLMAGMTTTAQETPADGGVTNPAMGTVQSEVLDDKAADELLRDPFWPVGYSPVTKTASAAGSQTAKDPLAPVAEDTLKRALSMVRVEGIIKRGSKCFATVNGTVVESGDTIPVMVDGSRIVFIVRSIDMKRLRIEPIKR